jgi:hypothetical protein
LRFAALAFGVVAGLVASLILALGGLDPTMLAHFDPRQLSVLRFGLFVIANLGVLGAGVVLAAPLAGAILFIVGAVAWVVAAILLRHGPDYVLLTPPALLLIAFAFALVAFLRRPARRMAARYYDEDEGIPPIRAAIFGQGGTGTPARVEAGVPSQPALRSYDEPDEDFRSPRDDDWRPGSRRPPPRQKPMFRDSEDDDEEESGFSRFARGFSSVASFGLYAALAGAAVLIFLNLRTLDRAPPAAAKIDAQSSELAVASAPPAAPILGSSSSPPPQQVAAADAPSLPATNLITAAPTLENSPMVAPAPATVANTAASEPITSPGGLVVADTPPATPSLPAPPTASSEAPADEPAPTPTVGTPANPMPFQILPAMAAERAKPAPKPAAPKAIVPKANTSPPTPKPDVGL